MHGRTSIVRESCWNPIASHHQQRENLLENCIRGLLALWWIGRCCRHWNESESESFSPERRKMWQFSFSIIINNIIMITSHFQRVQRVSYAPRVAVMGWHYAATVSELFIDFHHTFTATAFRRLIIQWWKSISTHIDCSRRPSQQRNGVELHPTWFDNKNSYHSANHYPKYYN